jgi:glyoxalase family protein
MNDSIMGIHHITAIAGQAQRNYDFYTKILGLRMVKKTVNFDDPETYHLYYGNEKGSPGTILTFFPWTYVKKGTTGVGMATEIGYSVPSGSLDFWAERFKDYGIKYNPTSERFGEVYLPIQDPDGLSLNLIVPGKEDRREPWETNDIKKDTATKGFHTITLTVRDLLPTSRVLTDIFGYQLLTQEGNFYRFVTAAVEHAAIVDILVDTNGKPGVGAGGTNHHVAFRVRNEEVLMDFRQKVMEAGLTITEKIDRNYFFSLYFREPGGILFEIATDNPGFDVDESLQELGTHLKLPAQYEARRSVIESSLPVLIR